MRISAMQRVEVEVDERELGWVLLNKVSQMLGNIDDAGCDWFTRGKDVFIGGEDWHVASDPDIATLVDAANILRYGKRITLD